MLMPGVERNGEDRALAPFETDLLAGVIPHRRRARTIEDHDHFFKELALRGELPSRRDLADIAVIGGAGSIMVDEDAGTPAPRPWLQRHRVQIRDVEGADDVEPLA